LQVDADVNQITGWMPGKEPLPRHARAKVERLLTLPAEELELVLQAARTALERKRTPRG
jgi:hypothetical protein